MAGTVANRKAVHALPREHGFRGGEGAPSKKTTPHFAKLTGTYIFRPLPTVMMWRMALRRLAISSSQALLSGSDLSLTYGVFRMLSLVNSHLNGSASSMTNSVAAAHFSYQPPAMFPVHVL